MSAIPYQQSQDVGNILNWDSLFYRVVHEVLITSNGLNVALNLFPKNTLCGIRAESICTIMRHIILRTTQFNKVTEFVRIKDIIQGIPSNSIEGCHFSRKWVSTILSRLNGNLLVKLRPSQNKIVTPLYGVDLPYFLWGVQALWQGELDCLDSNKDYTSQSIQISRLEHEQLLFEDDEEGPHSESGDATPTQAGSNLARRALRLLGFCVEYSNPYKHMFRFLAEQVDEPIKDWKSFLGDLRQQCPSRDKITMDDARFKEKVRNCRIGQMRRRRQS